MGQENAERVLRSGEELWISATAVDLFESCSRKWWFRYVQGIKVQNAHAERGEKIHTMLENWLRRGEIPPTDRLGRVASAIIPHLPPPQSVDPANVECEMGLRFAGVTFIGKIDLWMPDAPERPRVYDHKTTRDLVWAKQASGLHEDIQATLYAAWAQLKTNAREVDVQWTYGRVEGSPKTLPVVRTLSGGEIRDRLQKTIETARDIQLVHDAQLTDFNEVPYDAGTCEAFGGCPHREVCNLSPKERIGSIMGQGVSKSSFLQRLKNNKETAAAAVASAPKEEPKKSRTNNKPADPPAARSGSALSSLRTRKVNPPPEPEPVHTPEPEPVAEPEEQESPRRRGRPAGSVAKPQPAPLPDVWVAFCRTALQTGADEPQAVADELLGEYIERFGE